MLPWAEVQFSTGDSDDRFPAHDRSLQVRISVLLLFRIVPIALVGELGGKFFKPFFKIFVEAFLHGVDEYTRCDIHRIGQNKPFLDSALSDRLTNRLGDVDQTSAFIEVKPKLFSICHHTGLLLYIQYIMEFVTKPQVCYAWIQERRRENKRELGS